MSAASSRASPSVSDVDPLLVRIGFGVIAIITFGAALAAYVLAWIAIPKEGAERGHRPPPDA